MDHLQKRERKDESLSAAGQEENESLSDDTSVCLRLSADADVSDEICQKTFTKQNCHVFVASGLAALGGLMFGYDTGIVSGALLQLEEEFQLSCHEIELVVSAMLIGALIAALMAGTLVDRIGRRLAVVINAVVFTIGSIVLALSVNFFMMMFGRLVIGYGVSLSAIAECIYISEISPNNQRGFLVSLNEFCITLGFLLAYLINYLLINVNHGWRYMFGIGAIPAIVQGVGMLYMPKSPRFLLLQHDEYQARKVLIQLRCNTDVYTEMKEIQDTINRERNMSYKDLLKMKDNMLGRMAVGLMLVIFQQITGQPSILYYAPTVFQQLGFRSSSAATLASVGLGTVKVLFTGVALYNLDKWGRRKLLIGGTTVMMLSILALGLVAGMYKFSSYAIDPCSGMKHHSASRPNGSLIHEQFLHDKNSSSSAVEKSANLQTVIQNISEKQTKNVENYQTLLHDETAAAVMRSSDMQKNDLTYTTVTSDPVGSHPSLVAVWFTSISLMIFVAGYSLGFGPGTWLVLSEIFPATVRGRAMSCAIVFNWLFNLIITSTFLDMISTLNVSTTFLCYGSLCVLGILFIWLCIPETKGKSLEEITAELQQWSCKHHFKENICCNTMSSDITVQYRLMDGAAEDMES